MPLLYDELGEFFPDAHKRSYIGDDLDDSIEPSYDAISELVFDRATYFMYFWYNYHVRDLTGSRVLSDGLEQFVDTTKMAHYIVMDTVEDVTMPHND